MYINRDPSQSMRHQDPWAERVQPQMKSAVMRSLEAVRILEAI